MSAEVAVVVSRHGVDRLRKGHVWVYKSDVRAPSDLRGGEVVRLEDDRGYFLGRAFYGKTSQISVRLLTREDEPVDEEFFARRLSAAKALRDAAEPDPERVRAARVVHGESDLLPGLVVDRYAGVLSVQTLIEATDARREMFASMLGRNTMGRMGTPEEVANAVGFLASPRASFITGTNLIIDGALTQRVQF